MNGKILMTLSTLLSKWYTAFLSAFLFIYVVNRNIFHHLNSFVFAPSGDGIKNYYTYMFQAKYGDSFWNFKGMNYPFYEHIVYTDAHPLLAFIVGKLGLEDYGVGILNFLMLISFPIAAALIHSLLKHYKVSSFWSYFAALSICLMSPQIFRITGHLSLSYVFAIPLMWWLILKIEKQSGFIWPVLMFITLLVFFFTHPYLGLILAVFGLFYVVVFWLSDKSRWRKYLLGIALPIFSSIGLFQFMVSLTDSHVDRMKTPTGFFEMYAKWNSLLVPHHGPMNKLKHLLGWRMSSWESWTYLGLFVIVIILFLIGYFVRHRKQLNFFTILSTPIGKMYIVGHLVLLFSFCFPLKYDFLKWIVEFMGPLKQFRVLGRFAWVYFYVASILSVSVLYQIMLKSSKQYLFQAFFYVGIGFSVLEFLPTHLGISKAISKKKNPFILSNLNQEEQELIRWTKEQDYDAILFLPFSHLSSENIFLLGTEKASYHAFLLSYHTNLPLLNTVSSRTSVAEAIAFHNLFSPEYVEKTFQDLLPEDAEIMMVKNRAVLDENELRMTYASDGVYENDEFNVFKFSFDDWNDPFYFNEVVKQYNQSKVDLGKGWFSDTSGVNYIYESFDEIKERNTFSGKGALAGQKNGFHVIKPDFKLDTGNYICSFWYNFRVDRADQAAIVEQKFKSGRGEWVAKNDIRQSNHIVGDWLLVEIPFSVSDSVESTKIILSGRKNKKWFIVDELLIRENLGRPLFRNEERGGDQYIVYNNYRLKKNSFSE